MTDDDHIDDDDLSVKQMRSVWLSMRDDDAEPSDRGMAALMAAAREQAEAMKPKKAWWVTLFDQLRRPPVLAMATVVVLIGGAVVISQRNDRGEMRTASERVDEPAPGAADKNVAPTLPAEELDGTLDEERAAGSSMAAPEPPPAVTEPPRSQPVRPKPRRSAGPSVGQGRVTADRLAPPPADPAPAPKKEPTRSKLELATGDEDDMQPKGGFAESTSVAPQAPDPKPVARKPLPSIEGEDRAAKDSSVALLVKQCEAAAAKNDCAAVRSIAQKIAKQDPSTYRLKVAKNAAVARCLEPPAPIEAAPPADAN